MPRIGLTNSKIVNRPLKTNVKLLSNDKTLLDYATLYQQLAGSLIYLTMTRPCFSYAVTLVRQFMHSPHSTHYVAILEFFSTLEDFVSRDSFTHRWTLWYILTLMGR